MRGHDHLAAHVVRNSVFAAEFDHGCRAAHAKASLHRTWLVVHAGVDHTAIVSALMAGDALLFLDDKQAPSWKTARDFESDAESDDATPDDDHVVARVGHAGNTPRSRPGKGRE